MFVCVCVGAWGRGVPSLKYAFGAQNTIELLGDMVVDFHFVLS